MIVKSSILKTSQPKLRMIADIFVGNTIKQAIINVQKIQHKRVYTYIKKSILNLKNILSQSKEFNVHDSYIEQSYAVRHKSVSIIRRHARHRVGLGSRNFSKLVFIINKVIPMIK